MTLPLMGARKLYLKLVRRSQARRGNPFSVPRRLHLSATPQVSGPKGSSDHDHRYHSGCPQQTYFHPHGSARLLRPNLQCGGLGTVRRGPVL
jgi:hypothetical protein